MSDVEKGTLSGKYLTLTLAEEFFALDINSVREILDMTEITRIPQTPEYMRGVVNLRGNAVPVIDLRRKFGLGCTEQTINTRIVIMEVIQDHEQNLLGALADSVKEVLELDASQIDPPPKMGTKVKAEFIKGIAKHNNKFILLMDINKAFSAEELGSVQEVLAASTDTPPPPDGSATAQPVE